MTHPLRILLLLMVMASGGASMALAQKMHDYSLSPAETFSQSGNKGGRQDTSYQNYLKQNGFNKPAADPRTALGAPAAQPAGSFMEGYCDPDFRPAIAANPRFAGMEECLNQAKQQLCASFAQLPPEVKATLNETLSCMNDTTDPVEGDVQEDLIERRYRQAGCAANSSDRLQLLRKYWQDQNVSYALVFLPDDVIDAPNNCIRRR